MDAQFTIKWFDRGRPPRLPANPAYPHGITIDSGARPACRVELPYLTQKHVGYWYVECSACQTTMLITVASRPDDPRSVMLPCAPRPVFRRGIAAGEFEE